MFFNKILNTKGSILPITITGLVIMMVAGLACMKMFSFQNKLNDFDKIKLRVQYAAEGAVEICRGLIAHDGSYLTHNVTDWSNYDDNSKQPPKIEYKVECVQNNDCTSYGFAENGTYVNYTITGQARSTVTSPEDGSKKEISCTVRYFFEVENIPEAEGVPAYDRRHFIGWAKDPIVIVDK